MHVARRQTFTHFVLIIVVRLLSTIIQRSAGQPACADTTAELLWSKGEETTDDADWATARRAAGVVSRRSSRLRLAGAT